MPELIDIASARGSVLEHARTPSAEEVPLTRGLGRVLADDLTTEDALPPFDSSAMVDVEERFWGCGSSRGSRPGSASGRRPSSSDRRATGFQAP